MIKVDNAIIMAAGMSSRFLPLTVDKPKALLEVKNEVLIERLISQLQAVGITEIVVVGGYCFETLEYLVDKYNIILVENKDYLTRNNHSSLFAVKDYLKNSYICSSDNYYPSNVFKVLEEEAYYSCVYTDESTNEWVVETDSNRVITKVMIGAEKGYYMLGHAFFDEKFSKQMRDKISEAYALESTKNYFWEDIYLKHIETMTLKMKDLTGLIYEFDNLAELQSFDDSYLTNTRSTILKELAKVHAVFEADIKEITPIKQGDVYIGFSYVVGTEHYQYFFER